MLRFVWLSALLFIFGQLAWAEEKITNYHVDIEVLQNADFIVTEKISVISEGRRIRRGIFRDLPRYKMADDVKIPYQYKILSITRNGNKEPFDRDSEGNATQVRIGDADVFLRPGQHNYEITYSVKNEVRYFDDFDEVYWNAIGTYWAFPIDKATARISFPSSIVPTELNCFTGSYGARESACAMQRSSSAISIEATRSFRAREGMAVSIKFPKGIIDPPSASDKRAIWWFKNGAVFLLAFSFVGLFGYYYLTWLRVGKDPVKDPTFARYEPPKGYSPAAVHHVYYRGLRGHKALIATLVDMAVKGRVELDSDKKTTVLKQLSSSSVNDSRVPVFEHNLQQDLFPRSDQITLGKSYNSTFTKAYTRFTKKVSRDYGKDYFRWNFGYTLIGIILSAAAVIVAVSQFYGNLADYFAFIIAALVAMNLAFLYFMPAPTKKGQKIRQEIAGFKLYLETAEKQKLNAVKAGTDQPLPMSKEQYEAFLPYAIALNVEKPWTKYFEKVLPQEAKNYNPGWTNMRAGDFGSIGGMSDAITSNLSSGVSKSMPQSSSSSGGGGGGFSGGGGGGGGGGGW